MRFFILIFISWLLFIQKGLAQYRIKGRVLDTLGSGIPNATVQAMKNVTTISDQNGYFELMAKGESGNLSISHLNYDPRVIQFSNNTRELTIILRAKNNSLEEVEVIYTGYQALPKERSTGSFITLKREDLESRVSGNIMQRLEGLAPGLFQDKRGGDQLYRFNIRGINSLTAGMMGPLIILDNFPFEGSLDMINPEEIENVTVLRDAAATSIWGARAGNGVIVLTTKKAGRHGLKIEASANTVITAKPDFFYRQAMNSEEFIEVEKFLFEKGHYNSALKNVNNRTVVFSPVVQTLDNVRKGLMSEKEGEDLIRNLSKIDYRKQLSDRLYRNFLQQQLNFSISSGSEIFSNRLSVGANLSKGEKLETSNNRLNVSNQSSFQFSQKFGVQTNIAYVYLNDRTRPGVSTYPINPGGGKTSLYPYALFEDSNGNPLAVPNGYNMKYVDSVGNGRLLDWLYRPMEDWKHSEGNSPTNHLSANVSAGYEPIKGLKFTLDYSIERQVGNSNLYYGEDSYFARDLINRFTILTDEEIIWNLPKGGIQNRTHAQLTAQRGRIGASFNHVYDGGHAVNLLLGSEISDSKSSSNSYGYYGYDKNTGQVGTVDYTKSYPILLGGANYIPNNNGIFGGRRRFVSFFGNGSYEYRGKYTLSFSARRDASNQFGVRTNDLWKPLWSAGLMWNLKNEDFMKNTPLISEAKFRVTYGSSGNSGGNVSGQPVLSYSTVKDYWTAQTYATVSALPNGLLKWETVNTLNLGVQVGLLNHFDINFEWFRKQSRDLIAPDEIDPTTGFYNISRNVGRIKGSGFDLEMGLRNIGNRLRWSSTLSLSRSRSIVKEFQGTLLGTYSYASSGGRSLQPILDRELYPIFAYRFAGLDAANGDPQGNLGGEISKAYNKLITDSLQNLHYFGSALPRLFGNFRNNFTYKNWNLSFNITYRFGHHFFAETIKYASLYNNWTTHSDYGKRWQEPGDEKITTVPSMTYPANTQRDNFYAASEVNVHPADVIRLQDVQASYRFKGPIGGIKHVQLYTTLSNVAILWRANRIARDPDVTDYPLPFSGSIGFRVQF